MKPPIEEVFDLKHQLKVLKNMIDGLNKDYEELSQNLKNMESNRRNQLNLNV